MLWSSDWMVRSTCWVEGFLWDLGGEEVVLVMGDDA